MHHVGTITLVPNKALGVVSYYSAACVCTAVLSYALPCCSDYIAQDNVS